MITNIELAWIAGFLEGEGCFYTWSKEQHIPMLSVWSIDKDVIENVQKFFRTPIQVRKPTKLSRKPSYGLQLSGSHAAGWMMTLYTFLSRRRRAKILELLAPWKEHPINPQQVGNIWANNRRRLEVGPCTGPFVPH